MILLAAKAQERGGCGDAIATNAFTMARATATDWQHDRQTAAPELRRRSHPVKMNQDSLNIPVVSVDTADTRPLLIVPYNWIGDFVRGHTVVRVAKQRWPRRPVDILTTPLCAPLADYMPDVRSAIV